MAVRWQAFAIAALAMVAFAGIALGAETQKETFLHPEKLQGEGLRDAASNLVTLTAVIPGLAVAIIAGSCSQAPWRARVVGTLGVLLSVAILVWLVQSSWPNYDALEEQRVATFSITPLVSNGAAVPSVYLGVLSLFVACAQILQLSGRAMFPGQKLEPTPAGQLRQFLASYLLAAPFLIILVAGNLRLVIALGSGQASAIPYLLLLPLGALAALGLLVVGLAKAWHVGAFVRNGRMRDSAETACAGLQKAEWVLAGSLVIMAVLATLFAALSDPLLEAGRTFAVTARGHMQMQAFLLFPLVPWLAGHRALMTAFQGNGGDANMSTRTKGSVIVTAIVVGIALLATVAVTWLATGALWPWVAAGLPLSILAWAVLPARLGAGTALVTAIAFWGIGNTVTGSFALRTDTSLTFHTLPGVLVLFRLLAVLVVAVAVARATRTAALDLPASVSWSLTLGATVAAALIPYLELPFTAWIAPTIDGEFVGIGSLLASQDYSVRVTLHVIGALASFIAGLIASRLLRPDWFAGSPPLPELAPVTAAA